MAGDYTKQAASARNQIRKKGQVVNFARRTSVVNTVTGEDTGVDVTTWGGFALRVPNYKGVSFDGMDTAFKSGMVLGTSTVFLVPAYQLEHQPQPGDTITLGDGSIWSIKGMTSLNPSGQPILHTVGAVKL